MSPSDSRTSDRLATPSAFFRQHASTLEESLAIGPTLDLACGRGRHALAAAALGLSVTAVDRNSNSLDELMTHWRRMSTSGIGAIETLCADLEEPPLPPLEARQHGAVLVFNYLHRPLFGWIESLVAPGGLVLYETFTEAQKTLGWGPQRDAYLLKSGELPKWFPDLEIVVYEEGLSSDPRPAQTARLLARRPVSSLA